MLLQLKHTESNAHLVAVTLLPKFSRSSLICCKCFISFSWKLVEPTTQLIKSYQWFKEQGSKNWWIWWMEWFSFGTGYFTFIAWLNSIGRNCEKFTVNKLYLYVYFWKICGVLEIIKQKFMSFDFLDKIGLVPKIKCVFLELFQTRYHQPNSKQQEVN